VPKLQRVELFLDAEQMADEILNVGGELDNQIGLSFQRQ